MRNTPATAIKRDKHTIESCQLSMTPADVITKWWENLSFKGRVALLPGMAGPGIPRSTALHFAAAGATVVGFDVEDGVGPNTVDDIHAQGGNAVFFNADATDAGQVRDIVDEARKLGPIECLVNLTGQADPDDTNLFAISDDELAEKSITAFRANTLAPLICSRAVLPHMLADGRGKVLFLDTLNTVCSFFRQPLYAIGKSGLAALNREIALYSSRGIRSMNLILGTIPSEKPSWLRRLDQMPGLLRTLDTLYPAGCGDPDQVARLITFLCLDDCWVSGVNIYVDGGYYARGGPPIPCNSTDWHFDEYVSQNYEKESHCAPLC